MNKNTLHAFHQQVQGQYKSATNILEHLHLIVPRASQKFIILNNFASWGPLVRGNSSPHQIERHLVSQELCWIGP